MIIIILCDCEIKTEDAENMHVHKIFKNSCTTIINAKLLHKGILNILKLSFELIAKL